MPDLHAVAASPAVEAAPARVVDVRRPIGIVLGPALFLLLLAVPLPELTPEAHRLSAVLGLVIVFWVTEVVPLPVTALMGPALAVLLGVARAETAFAPMANPLIFVFMGSFILAHALFVHRVNERIAYAVLSLRLVGARPARILVAYGAVTAMVSAWMSNTATAAMLLPIGLSLLHFMESEARVPRAYGTSLMLATSYGASRGGIATPVGTPPNLITVGMLATIAGVQITFAEWMALAVPISVVLMTVVSVLLLIVSRPLVGRIPGAEQVIKQRRQALGAWQRGEVNALVAFGVTVALWVIPGLLPLALGADHPVSERAGQLMPESVAALVGATLLFFLPIDETRRSTLTWQEAARIDWGTILLFGGGMALGAMTASTGLAEAVGRAITGLLSTDSVLALSFGAAAFAVVLSETMSNTAAATISVPIVISIALASGLDPVAPAMSAGLAASVGDALPVSTPPNAIVYASGRVPLVRMIQLGIILDILAIALIPPSVVGLSHLLR
jgi:sodium-dependent dicarboxylate transporter 2/3/5